MRALTRTELHALIDQQHRDNTDRLTNWALWMLAGLYRRVDPARIDASFARVSPLVTGTIIHAKQRSVLQTWAQTAMVAKADGVPFDLTPPTPPSFNPDLWSPTRQPPRPVFDPWAAVGGPQVQSRPATPGFDATPMLRAAPDLPSGRTVDQVQRVAPFGVKRLIGDGMPPLDAVRVSQGRASSLAGTEVPRAAREAAATAAETVQGFRRWRRVPAPGACDFCLMLASRGAVYRDPVVAGGQYHAHCRCQVQMETDPDMREASAIHPDDLRLIRVTFSDTSKVWEADLSAEYQRYVNLRRGQPPDPRWPGADQWQPQPKRVRQAAERVGYDPAAYLPGAGTPQRLAAVELQLTQLRDNPTPWASQRRRELEAELASR